MNWLQRLKVILCCYSKCTLNEKENVETAEEQYKRYISEV